MSLGIPECPLGALAELRANETTQTVLATIRRVEPDSFVFSEESLDAVTDPDIARIYHMNIGAAVHNFIQNTEVLRTRHSESVRIANSLVAEVLPVIAGRVKIIDDVPLVYGKTYDLEEMSRHANEASRNPIEKNSELKSALGVPEAVTAFPAASLATFYETWSRLENDGYFQVGIQTRYAPKLKLYAADMTDSGSFNAQILGIGDYGEEITDKLFLTHAIISQSITRNKEAFLTWESQHPDAASKLIRSITRPRTKDAGSLTVSQMTTHEGCLSIAQSLSVLTNDCIEDYPDVNKLIHDLVVGGVVGKFAKKMPFSGIVGPLAMSGLTYFPLLSSTSSGIGLHHVAEVAFSEARRAMRDKIMVNGRTVDHYESGKSHMTFSGCPAAYDTSDCSVNGVQSMAELFLDVFEKL